MAKYKHICHRAADTLQHQSQLQFPVTFLATLTLIAQEQVILFLANEEQHAPTQSMGLLRAKWYCYS